MSTQWKDPTAYNGSSDDFRGSSTTMTSSAPPAPYVSENRNDYSYRASGATRASTTSANSSGKHEKQTPAEIKDMKGKRKRRTVASGVAGGVLGLVVGGPLLGIAGGVGGAVVAKKVGRRNEKRRMDELEARQNPLRASGEGEVL